MTRRTAAIEVAILHYCTPGSDLVQMSWDAWVFKGRGKTWERKPWAHLKAAAERELSMLCQSLISILDANQIGGQE